MSFPADWVVTKQQGSTGVALDTASPLVGNGTLFIHSTVSPDRVSLYNTTYSNGLTQGRLRSIMNITQLTSGQEERAGFVFMLSNANLALGTTAGYGAFFNAGNGLSSPRITITKFTSGLPNAPTELDATSSFIAPSLGAPFVFEADWVADLSTFNGTQIIVRYGLGTNFASLSQVLIAQDSSSPIITSSFEGLGSSFFGTGQFRVEYEETNIYQLL